MTHSRSNIENRTQPEDSSRVSKKRLERFKKAFEAKWLLKKIRKMK